MAKSRAKSRAAKSREGGGREPRFNATTHGVLSKRPLLEGEDAAELAACERGWRETYAPRDYREQTLVEQLIINEWFLRRATRRLVAMETEEQAGPDFEHRLALLQRYKTAAERAFFRALSAVEHLRKDLIRESMQVAQMAEREKKAAEKAAEKASKQPEKKPQKTIKLAEQWVEVRVNEQGETETELFPPNEELRAEVEKLDPRRDLVYRRFHFVDGVPKEYAWTAKGLKVEPHVKEYGGAGIQRMRPLKWFEQIEKEKREGNGHLLACGANVPRPEERGGCDCEVCSENREAMEEECDCEACREERERENTG